MHLEPWKAQTLCINITHVPPLSIHSKLLSSIWKDQIALQNQVCATPSCSEELFLWSSLPYHVHTENLSCRASTAWLESLALSCRHGALVKFWTPEFPSVNRACGISCNGPREEDWGIIHRALCMVFGTWVTLGKWETLIYCWNLNMFKNCDKICITYNLSFGSFLHWLHWHLSAPIATIQPQKYFHLAKLELCTW